MATISYTLKAAYSTGYAGGVVFVDNFRSYDVGAHLTAGSGTITEDAADTALIAALDGYAALKRSGTNDTGTAAATTRTGQLVVARPEPATAGYVPVLQADGTWVATAPANASSGASSPGSRIFFVGDSQVQKGVSDGNADGTGTSFAPLLQGRAWYAWAEMLSEGSMIYAGQAATGGFTTAQILATHVPTAVAQAAKLVCVLAGRNDVVNAVSFSTTVSNLKAIWAAIVAAGKTPILCTLPAQPAFPTATATQITAAAKINAFIRKQALFSAWPLVDFETVTTDPATGGQKTGMFVDASHPNHGLGARTMGTELYNKIKPYLAPYKPPYAAAQTNPANGDLNLMPNPLLLTDTNTDGVPDNWTTAGAAASKAYSIYDPSTTGNDGLGKWFRVARTASTGAAQAFGDKVAVTPGDVVAFSFRFKSSLEAVGAWCAMRLIGTPLTGDNPTSVQTQFVAGINTWLGDVTTPGLFYMENTIAAGVNFVSPVISISVGTGAASIDVGQVGIFNLTQMGALS